MFCLCQNNSVTWFYKSSDYDLDGQTGKYNESVLVFPFSLLSVMLDRTKKISLEVKLNTLPENQFLDFYKDYSMDMTVIINVEKLISQTILEWCMISMSIFFIWEIQRVS